MKRALLLLIALAISGISIAQSFSGYFKEGLYQFNDTMKILATDIFATYSSQFNFSQDDGMVFKTERAMENGNAVQRYIQFHNGYPVEGTMMNVISKYGIVLYINGFCLPNFTLNTPLPILESDALDSALHYIGASKYAWEDSTLEKRVKYSFDPLTADTVWDTTMTLYPKGELVIAHPFGDTAIHDTSNYSLCWKF